VRLRGDVVNAQAKVDAPVNRVRCPECKRTDGLWIQVTVAGWRSLTDEGKPTGPVEGVDLSTMNSEATSEVGCTCGWESLHSQLERVGVDDQPLPQVNPWQGTLAIA
jgi:hypothetical protein